MATTPDLEKLKPKVPILIFDIETVPDVPLVSRVYAKKKTSSSGTLATGDSADLGATLGGYIEPHFKDIGSAQKLLELEGVKFPAPMFHSVISICAIFVHPETFCIMDGFRKSVALPTTYKEFLDAERGLIQQFWNFMLKYQDFSAVWYDTLQADYRLNDFQRKKLKPFPVTLCGYNIVGFDLPVLEQRSMKNMLTCPFQEYARDTGYDSYRSKFAPDKTFDLCQYMAGSGQHKTNLDTVSRAMGLGGKMQGMDGSKVADEYFLNGVWEKIEEYCAVDVLVTYGVFLAVQKFRGFLTDEVFSNAVGHFEKFLRHEGRPTSYLELANCSQEFFAFGASDSHSRIVT